MALNIYIRDGDNVDITEERRKASFPTDELSKLLHGEEYLRKKRALSARILNTPSLHDTQPPMFLPREERIEETSRKLNLMSSTKPALAIPGDEMYFHTINEVIGVDGYPLALHNVMFLPSLQQQADDELQKLFVPRAIRGEIIGTYAQTEMGHGTNLRALETTATYDKNSQEFVVNSPTVTSIKWWPGNLGKSSNYAVVVAQLYLDGKSYGPHSFLVQLRCEKTHEPLKGITVGDIGPKIGYNTTDNGFLKLDHVRIPRTQMLMRHAKVSPDGKYSKPPHEKIGYGAMVHVRSHMIRAQAHFLAQASTIAIRYSAIRRQGEIKPGAGEVKILEYQTQQHRLFPQVARAYAYFFAGSEVVSMYNKTLDEIEDGKVGLMPDLHAVTSGMKAVVSFEVGKGVEQCRMACGGHGYSEASRIPEIYGTQIGGCTYEGENMVMLLQLARYLMKSAAKAKQGKPLSPLTKYLAGTELKSSIGTDSDPRNDRLVNAFEYVARRLTIGAYDRLQTLLKKGLSEDEAWQANAVEMNRASRAHTRLFIANAFRRKVHDAPIADERLKTVLAQLLSLFLNYELLDMSQYLLEHQYVSSAQMTIIRDNVYILLGKLRPNAVSLVDAFDITDIELRSVLGRRDGNVYENLLAYAKRNPVNKKDVLPGVDKYLMPMMMRAREQSKL